MTSPNRPAGTTESLANKHGTLHHPRMVNHTPPILSPALSSAWKNCERRCPKEAALLVSEFTEKMLDLEKRSEGGGIYFTLDAPKEARNR